LIVCLLVSNIRLRTRITQYWGRKKWGNIRNSAFLKRFFAINPLQRMQVVRCWQHVGGFYWRTLQMVSCGE
jgi:hypothetical protein